MIPIIPRITPVNTNMLTTISAPTRVIGITHTTVRTQPQGERVTATCVPVP
jgi:hypothetical protein